MLTQDDGADAGWAGHTAGAGATAQGKQDASSNQDVSVPGRASLAYSLITAWAESERA